MKRNQSSCGPFSVLAVRVYCRSRRPIWTCRWQGCRTGRPAGQRWSKSSAGVASRWWSELQRSVKVFTSTRTARPDGFWRLDSAPPPAGAPSSASGGVRSAPADTEPPRRHTRARIRRDAARRSEPSRRRDRPLGWGPQQRDADAAAQGRGRDEPGAEGRAGPAAVLRRTRPRGPGRDDRAAAPGRIHHHGRQRPGNTGRAGGHRGDARLSPAGSRPRRRPTAAAGPA